MLKLAAAEGREVREEERISKWKIYLLVLSVVLTIIIFLLIFIFKLPLAWVPSIPPPW